MERVLVVEDSRTQAEQIRMLLEEVPFQVELAGHGKAALEALRRQPPDIVLTDLEMPEMNGLELVEAIRAEFSWVPVVLITAHGSEEIAALALRKGAASYIPKAYLDHDVAPTLQRILSLSSGNRHHACALECLEKSEFQFALQNDPAVVPALVGYLDDMLKLLKFCDATDRLRTGIALHEACLNAIYHGNLELGSALRQEDEMAYHNLVQVRRAQPPFQDRRVYVNVKITPTEVVFVVRDQGHGFDPSNLPDPGDPANLEKIGGRGLMLIRTFMDLVYHNHLGNAITLVKRHQ